MHVNNKTDHSIILYGGSLTVNCKVKPNSALVNVGKYQSVKFFNLVGGSNHNTAIPYPATIDIKNTNIDIEYVNGSFTFVFH